MSTCLHIIISYVYINNDFEVGIELYLKLFL